MRPSIHQNISLALRLSCFPHRLYVFDILNVILYFDLDEKFTN